MCIYAYDVVLLYWGFSDDFSLKVCCCLVITVAALKGFLGGIKDPSGSLKNWKGDDPCGHDPWEGIVCSPPMDGNKRVTEL